MLRITVAGQRTRDFARTGVTIGRAADCDVVIDDLRVSRHHLRVEWRGETAWVVDQSANGIFVPGGLRAGELALTRTTQLHLGATDGPLLELGPPGSTDPAVLLDRLSITTSSGLVLIDEVSASIQPASLVAVLGPTGAGKSTLLKSLAGLSVPSTGSVQVFGRSLYEHYDELRPQIGYVPQDDIVHTRLTAAQALGYGAELRLADDYTDTQRSALVVEAADSLGLRDHLHKRISDLSGGQRKRVSVGLELLTRPAVLLLDEPTSGLDPGYEDSIMRLLRRLADDGCTVVVVTHSTASLSLCDQVVYLGTGGWVAYSGEPQGALQALGAQDHPHAFRLLERNQQPRSDDRNAHVAGRSTDPVGHQQEKTAETSAAQREPTYPNSAVTQFSALARRSAALLLADPRALGLSLISALVPGVLLAVIVGPHAFALDGRSDPGSARTLLTGVIISAGVIGAANGLREIVKELPIYQRERVAGLRRSTYLASKFAVLGAVTAAQAVVVVGVATLASSPGSGNLLPAHLELAGAGVLTALTCLVLGLFISAVVDTSEKALAMIPVVFVVLWLFSGTVSDLAETPLLSQLAFLSPSNWGVAAAASSVDLPSIDGCWTEAAGAAAPGPPPVCDERWRHGFWYWSTDLAVLAVLGLAGYVATDWALARKEHLDVLRRQHLAGAVLRRARALVACAASR